MPLCKHISIILPFGYGKINKGRHLINYFNLQILTLAIITGIKSVCYKICMTIIVSLFIIV